MERCITVALAQHGAERRGSRAWRARQVQFLAHEPEPHAVESELHMLSAASAPAAGEEGEVMGDAVGLRVECCVIQTWQI